MKPYTADEYRVCFWRHRLAERIWDLCFLLLATLAWSRMGWRPGSTGEAWLVIALLCSGYLLTTLPLILLRVRARRRAPAGVVPPEPAWVFFTVYRIKAVVGTAAGVLSVAGLWWLLCHQPVIPALIAAAIALCLYSFFSVPTPARNTVQVALPPQAASTIAEFEQIAQQARLPRLRVVWLRRKNPADLYFEVVHHASQCTIFASIAVMDKLTPVGLRVALAHEIGHLLYRHGFKTFGLRILCLAGILAATLYPMAGLLPPNWSLADLVAAGPGLALALAGTYVLAKMTTNLLLRHMEITASQKALEILGDLDLYRQGFEQLGEVQNAARHRPSLGEKLHTGRLTLPEALDLADAYPKPQPPPADA